MSSENDSAIREALERLTDRVDSPPSDPISYASGVMESRGRRWIIGPIAAIVGGAAVALLLAIGWNALSLTGEAPSPTAIPSTAPTTPGAPSPSSTTTSAPSPTASQVCQPIAPSELPDGSDPGGARLIEGDVVPVWEWGSGQNLVRLAINHPAFSGSEAPPPQMFDASVRGVPAAIQAIGDLPLSEVTFTWVVGDCTYTVWIGPGYDFEMAREYAARY